MTTLLEKQLKEKCYKKHGGDLAYDLEYDPTEGHYHVTPEPPEFLGDALYSGTTNTVYFSDAEWDLNQLLELRQWLNEVLKQVDD